MPSATNDINLTFLALGDSYTIGQGVSESERWPVQLTAGLRERGIAIAQPVIIARTGWTTTELIQAFEDRSDGRKYDLVSVLVGVNDQYRGYPVETYRQEFAELLAIAVSVAEGGPERVIVLSIPDWGVTPFAAGFDRVAVGNEIDAFNGVNREISETAGVAYFDITALSRLAGEQAGLLAEDGLHPSGEMYRMWVELLFDKVHQVLAGAHGNS